jgi:type I restriction enzyme R subunit
MVGNFTFLRAEWPELAEEATRAEHNAYSDPRAACFYARRCLELTLAWLYDADSTLKRPYRSDLAPMLFEPTLRTLVGNTIQAKMDIIRRQGNIAVHEARPVTSDQSGPAVRELFHVLYWLASHYTREHADLPGALKFDVAVIPKPLQASVRKQRLDEIKAQAERFAAQDAELTAMREQSATLEQELAELRAQVAAAKVANRERPDDHDYNEAATRDLFINLLLHEAGWPLDQARDTEFEVSGMPNNQGAGYVDYVLWGDDGKPLGLVEAKRTRRDAAVGQQQAKLYADCLEAAYGQRPVTFYSNGYDHWIWDDTNYPPRQVEGFYTKDELQLLIQRRTRRRRLADIVINDQIVERHYQVRAIRRISEAFENAHQRDALVVMATGAGKTRTVIALVDVLMRANWAKRVLFLADRVALVNQAVGAFKAHLPDAATVNLVTEKDAEGRVYVSTYPTMIGLINEISEDGRRFGPGYFDLVIIDEAHRSVYQKYGTIFQYFDSLLVGLTATPKNEIDRNTYRLFHLEDGVPTDNYDLAEAVEEHYLVPPRAVSVPLKFQREGIRYDELSEDEKDQWDLADWGEDDPPDSVTSDAVNKWLFNADTVDKMIETLMIRGHRVAGGDRLGKTIIFAKNSRHAEFIVQRFNLSYPEYRGTFARVITYQTEYAQSLIDDFSVKDKPPHIAISVDMLDTGIDIPEIINLVFFKIVRSRTKFWQMIGRGTRLCPGLYGPGEDKADFFVFDFCQNIEFFNQAMKSSEGSVVESLIQRLFRARLELVMRLDRYRQSGDGAGAPEGGATASEGRLRSDMVQLLHWQVANMNLDNIVVRPERRWVETYADLANWHALTPEQASEIGEHLSGLPTTARDDDADDEQAKRFDLLVLRLQLCALATEPSFDRLRSQVQEIASALLEKTNIPAVRAQQKLLDEVAGDDWWSGITLPMLELFRRRVRSLVKLIEKAKRIIVYIDLVDHQGEAVEMALSGLAVGSDFERFRAKARMYLRAHEDHVALQKLRRNRPLTAADLAELERMLTEAGVGEADDIARARRQASGLGLFIRGLVGLDRAAATEALDAFISGRTLTASQLDFVNLIVAHLTENGTMDAALLYESPFTEIAPHGPESLFSGPDIEQLIAILRHVRATAAPDEVVA